MFNKVYVYVKDNEISSIYDFQLPEHELNERTEHVVESETPFMTVELINGNLITLTEEQVRVRLNQMFANK